MSKAQSQTDKDRADNQVVFRGRNEKIQENIQKFNETAKELGQERVDTGGKEYLYFYCECSDEKCVQRIKVTFVHYKRIHKDRDTFVIKPNHEVSDVEKIIDRTPEYWVVKKYDYPSQTAIDLKTSGLDNS